MCSPQAKAAVAVRALVPGSWMEGVARGREKGHWVGWLGLGMAPCLIWISYAPRSSTPCVCVSVFVWVGRVDCKWKFWHGRAADQTGWQLVDGRTDRQPGRQADVGMDWLTDIYLGMIRINDPAIHTPMPKRTYVVCVCLIDEKASRKIGQMRAYI